MILPFYTNNDGTNNVSSFAPQYSKFEFPFKLHRLLDDAAKEGNEHIVSWLPDGKSFKIHSKTVFETKLIPRYYTSAPKYRSISRQLSIYGFKMILDPASPQVHGSYSHPLMVRGNPELCRRMTRQKIKSHHYQQQSSSSATKKRDVSCMPIEPKGHGTLSSSIVSPRVGAEDGDGLLQFAIQANEYLDARTTPSKTDLLFCWQERRRVVTNSEANIFDDCLAPEELLLVLAGPNVDISEACMWSNIRSPISDENPHSSSTITMAPFLPQKTKMRLVL